MLHGVALSQAQQWKRRVEATDLHHLLALDLTHMSELLRGADQFSVLEAHRALLIADSNQSSNKLVLPSLFAHRPIINQAVHLWQDVTKY